MPLTSIPEKLEKSSARQFGFGAAVGSEVGVSVGGTGVAVGGTGGAVGATGVAVGGSDVAAGGIDVVVEGIDVAVGRRERKW